MKTFQLVINKKFSQEPRIIEALVLMTKFDPKILCQACEFGAVWIERGKSKLRVRNFEEKTHLDDKLWFFYDPKVLSLPILDFGECIFENKNFGIWFKPAGVVSQGTQCGDHTSLLRFLEKKKKNVYLVHRLDRETAGLMIFAYNSDAAARFSNLFQKNLITKEYQAIVRGELPIGISRTIDSDLDGKKAITHFTTLEVREGQTLIKIHLETGRLHQIRRHLNSIGYPVIGDPKYGKNNKNSNGLKLLAYSLEFKDPWSTKVMRFNTSQMLNF